MHHSKLVNVLDAREDLSVHLASFWLLEPTILDDVLEKFASGAVLHDQVQVVIVFDHLQTVTLRVRFQ